MANRSSSPEDPTMMNGRKREIELQKLGRQERKIIVENVFKLVENYEDLLRKIRQRLDQVGVELPKVEVRFEHLSVKGDVHVGSRAQPTLLNTTLNFMEGILGSNKKKSLNILRDVSAILKPSRMTLLLGPPSSGKTTLLLALAGKSDDNLKVTGNITYCGHDFNEFVPKRTSAYISQHDLHYGNMTVRETLDFAARCLGVGTRYDLLKECIRREKQQGIKPDPEIDAFMSAIAMEGQEANVITDYVLRILGLDRCADTIVGDYLRRGISGGEKKRTTIGEMLVGPAKVLLLDEISTGLDSMTAYQICKHVKEMAHIMDMTVFISLLQPTPETYELFDDIFLLSEGQIVYQGPCEHVLEFFEYAGFKCPERKGVADFLQEVTSKKDQQQYWSINDQQYRYISVPEFVQIFHSFRTGQVLASELSTPYDRNKIHPSALVKEQYGVSNTELFKACFARKWLLMRRSAFLYVFKSVQITIMAAAAMTAFFRTTMHHKTMEDGGKYLGFIFFALAQFVFTGMSEITLTVIALPVFYKQRDSLFYPAWAYGLPSCIFLLPLSLMESALWTVLTYYPIGFAPAASRFFCQWLAYFCIHQMALSIFRFIGAFARKVVIAQSFGMILMVVVFVLGGFIIAKDDIGPWLIWAYYLSPMMYGQQALVINEFLDERWSSPNTDHRINETTVGKAILASRGFYRHHYWFWISIGALLGFAFVFNILFILALTYLNPSVDSRGLVPVDEDDDKQKEKISSGVAFDVTGTASVSSSMCTSQAVRPPGRGMVLPFQPLSLAFNHVNYYVDTPAEMKSLGYEDDRLQLLRDVSGAFRPGILTALIGVTGAGKTTLMDVLAGRKTRGYTEGSINVSGYPKNQATFARVCGYCEQVDIHSPYLSVYESLIFSAWLRLSSDVDLKARKMFIEEVMGLVELRPLSDALVGLPLVNGLSTEQRKRLTIAVELVANPSIIFMDEPTSGLDARAAAIVMRTVRNTVDTGRTVVCTIHQPSIDIFESFDEVFLMKRGGQIIYAGPLGDHSHKLIEFFQAIPGVPKIRDGYNPATWMLEISSPEVESQLNVDFAQIYAKSSLYERNQEIIKELSTPSPNSEDLHFPTEFSQPFFVQFKACFWKQYQSYWKNPAYNSVRFYVTVILGVMLGILSWNKGSKITKEQQLMDLFGVMFSAVLFLGGSIAFHIQTVVSTERAVFYREKAAGMYSALPFALAQLAIEAIYLGVITFCYALILFSMIGFEWNAGKFFYMYYFLFMCFMYYTTYGMMLLSLSPRLEISAVVMSFLVILWNLFGGFIIPKPQIPVWWRWYYWASPVAWTMYGLVTSQLGDISSDIEIPGEGDLPLNFLIEKFLGYHYDFLPVVAVAHLGWVFLFFLVFTYAIKFINFQQR